MDATFETPVGSLDGVPTERLEAQICAWAGRRAADDCAWLLLIAEFDRREGYVSWECRSTAHWLNWHCGLSLLAGRERVRVGRALERLEVVRGEFEAGRLTYSKVRAITRVATAATERELVELARAATAAQLEQICSAYRTVSSRHDADDPSGAEEADDQADDEEAEAEARAEAQHLELWERDGLVELRASIVADEAAVVEAAIASAIEHLSEGACRRGVPAGTPDAPTQAPTQAPTDEAAPWPTRLEGLIEVCRAYLAATPTSPGVERRHLVALVDVSALTATGQLGIDPDGRCTLGGRRITPETARQLGCSAALTQVLIDHRGLPLSVGRRSRVPTPAQRLALDLRDHGHCRYPGCPSRHVDAHHILEWDHAGPTDLDNLVLLCPYHHRLIHRAGHTITLDPTAATVQVRRPDGSIIASRTPDPADLPPRGPVADDAVQPGEAGTPLHLDDITEHLAWLDDHPPTDDHPPVD